MLFRFTYLLLFCSIVPTVLTKKLSPFVIKLIDESKPEDEFKTRQTFEFLERHYNSCEVLYYGLDRADQKMSLAQVTYATVVGKHRAAYYMDYFIHRYDDLSERQISGGPLANLNYCLEHLSDLNERSIKQRNQRASSKDIDLYKLMDTYGRVPSGFTLGNVFWPGDYDQCIGSSIKTSKGQLVSLRFCWVLMKYKDWPLNGMELMKMGVCLPKSCDSMVNPDKYKLVQNLIEYNGRNIDHNNTQIVDLYCLPDEKSELRQWYRSQGAIIFVFLTTIWLIIVVYCTYKFETFGKKPKIYAKNEGQEIFELDLYKTLAITSNFKKLFKTNPMYCLKRYQQANYGYYKEKAYFNSSGQLQKPILNLDVIDGIKGLAMFNIISAHALFFASSSFADVKVFGDLWSPVYFWCHMMPGFTVNLFFSISGFLTSYLLFKRNQQREFMHNPVEWLVLISNRYIKLIVGYVFIVAYSKYIAKFTNSGPFWDYATTRFSMRKVCEQEPWYWTLLMIANMKSPDEHCAAFGWYISSDIQFFAVVPIFIITLKRSPKFGQLLILVVSIMSGLASSMQMSTIPYEHSEPVARFGPFGFLSLLSHFKTAYTMPWYRITTYLIGILFGYYTFQYECMKQKYIEERELLKSQGKSNPKLEKPKLPFHLENYGSRLCLILALWFSTNSYILKALHPTKVGATLVAAIIVPVLHTCYSLVCALYIMIGAARLGSLWLNRILAAPFWKPLSRMSLCALVVNLEFIQYYLQGMSQTQPLTSYNLLVVYAVSIIGTYLFSSILFILYEEPLSRYLQGSLFKLAIKYLKK